MIPSLREALVLPAEQRFEPEIFLSSSSCHIAISDRARF